MMKALSLKLHEDIFEEAERITRKIKKPRNRYINDALRFYNMYNQRRLLKKQLHRESALVRKSSLEILREYEQIGDGALE